MNIQKLRMKMGNRRRTAEELDKEMIRVGIVSLAVMGSRVLGLAREIAIRYFFRADWGADAFNLAFRIPNFLRDLFGEGILSKAFITTFLATEAEEGEATAWQLANRVFTLTFFLLSALSALGIIFAPAIVSVLTREGFEIALDSVQHYGFSSKVELTIYLTQMMCPYLICVSLAAIAMGLLNSKGKFGVPACASSFFNISSLIIGIGGYYVCTNVGLHPTTGMAVGVLVGGIAQFLVQVPSMWRVGFRYRPQLSFRNPRVRQVIHLVAPSVLGVAALQVNLFINTHFITSETAWLTWNTSAYRVMHLPIGIFGVAISTVALPQLAKFATVGDTDNFRNALSHALRLMLTLTVPAAVGLMVLSEPICRLLYERGATSEVDTIATAGILSVYAFGLCGFSAVKIVTDGFYAYKDIRAPVIVSIGTVALNIGMNYLFIYQKFFFDYRAVALSTACTVTLNFSVLLLLLHRKVGGLVLRPLIPLTMKILTAGAVMGVMCWVTNGTIEADWLGTEGFIARFIGVFVPIAIGVCTLGIMYKVLNVQEFHDILRLLRRSNGK